MLKGRFRILKLPFEFQHAQHIDYVFYTCAYLHNRIQRYKGFDRAWVSDSDWTGHAGRFNAALCGVRRKGVGRIVRVCEDTDHMYVGGYVHFDHDEVDNSEHEAWQFLGDALASHYESEMRAGRVKWPKHQRVCAVSH